jgi:hypothetical protein
MAALMSMLVAAVNTPVGLLALACATGCSSLVVRLALLLGGW